MPYPFPAAAPAAREYPSPLRGRSCYHGRIAWRLRTPHATPPPEAMMTESLPERPPSGPAASDASLLRRFRGGDGDAATQLYLRYPGQPPAPAPSHAAAHLPP